MMMSPVDGEPEGNEPTFIVKKLKSWPRPLVTMERTYQVNSACHDQSQLGALLPLNRVFEQGV